jgi:hypothetical protein
MASVKLAFGASRRRMCADRPGKHSAGYTGIPQERTTSPEGAVETDVAAIRDAKNRTDDREYPLGPKSGRDAAATNSGARGRIEGPRRSDTRSACAVP